MRRSEWCLGRSPTGVLLTTPNGGVQRRAKRVRCNDGLGGIWSGRSQADCAPADLFEARGRFGTPELETRVRNTRDRPAPLWIAREKNSAVVRAGDARPQEPTHAAPREMRRRNALLAARRACTNGYGAAPGAAFNVGTEGLCEDGLGFLCAYPKQD